MESDTTALYYDLKNGFTVISAVEVVTEGLGREPQYHLSMTRHSNRGGPLRRVSSSIAKMIVKQFDLEGAEEDNHVPHGIARNFWRPVAEVRVGRECPCKEEETAVVEDKGDFVWRHAP